MDPSISSLSLATVTLNYDETGFSIDYVQELELVGVSKERNPEMFYSGSPFEVMEGVTPYILTLADPSQAILKNNFETVDHVGLMFSVVNCKQSDLPPG